MNRYERLRSYLALATTISFAVVAGSALAAMPYSEDWSAGDTNGWIDETGGTISWAAIDD